MRERIPVDLLGGSQGLGTPGADGRRIWFGPEDLIPGLELRAGRTEKCAYRRLRSRSTPRPSARSCRHRARRSPEGAPAVDSDRGRERADPVYLRLAPDQIGGLSTVALTFVELRDADACRGHSARLQTSKARTTSLILRPMEGKCFRTGEIESNMANRRA